MRKSQAEAGVDQSKVVSNYSTVAEWFCKGGKKPRAFLSFTVHIHSSNLWWSPYSNHQQRLAEIIADLRNDREMTFPRIAD